MERAWLRWAVAGRALRWFRPRLELLEDRAVPALVVSDLTTGLTPTQLVQNLVGAGVAVSNVTFTGDNTQGALFSGGTGIIGFESGVVLSTGHATDVIGPNTDDEAGTDLGGAGDPQLDAIVAPNTTFDAAVLEFDFVPQGSTLKFNYVFSSEEYNEFVGAGFNDVFAFFLNGSNVALLPGTTTPTSIDNVNDGNPTTGTPPTNPQFYINNALNTGIDPLPATGPLLDTQMDGLTVVLPVVANVNPGVVNHIKLAIADTGDGILDSNVFIQSGSFSAPLAPVYSAYRPFRYAFRTLEQNQGTNGPAPLGGLANQETFDGNLTLINVGTAASTGGLQVELRDLPPGVQLVNATGIDPITNQPFITVPLGTVPIGGVVRVPIKLSNPLHQPLGTFFLAAPFVDVTSAS